MALGIGFGPGIGDSQSRAPAPLPILASDSFTDTNGTALQDHTMEVGAGWTIHAGTWEIQSGKVIKTADDGTHQLASIDVGQSNCTVRAQHVVQGGGGLAFRITDNNNFLGIQVSGNYNLYKRDTGTFSLLQSAGTADDGPHDLKAVLLGANIDVYVDGVLLFSYATATFNQTATRHGLWLNQITAEMLDNFEVAA